MAKWGNYILLAALGIVAFMVYKTNKMMSMQTALLMGMAKKMGVMEEVDEKEKGRGKRSDGRGEEPNTDEENAGKEIERLAKKLYAGDTLTRKEKEFYETAKLDINKQTFRLLQEDLVRISDAIENKEVLSRADAEHYKEKYDKYKDSFALAELTDEVEIEEEEANTGSSSKKENAANPETEAERLHVMLSLFDDGNPKSVMQLQKLYAEATGNQPSSGTTGKLLDNLLENKKLMNQKLLIGTPKRNKVYYGLATWFDGKKFSKEYMNKIPK